MKNISQILCKILVGWPNLLLAANKLLAEGYEIESTAAGLTQAGMITKVFIRKK